MQRLGSGLLVMDGVMARYLSHLSILFFIAGLMQAQGCDDAHLERSTPSVDISAGLQTDAEARVISIQLLTYQHRRPSFTPVHWCTGQVVGHRAVLTAAHCVCAAQSNGYAPEFFRFRESSGTVNNLDLTYEGRDIEVEDVYMPPGICDKLADEMDPTSSGEDLALLKTTAPIGHVLSAGKLGPGETVSFEGLPVDSTERLYLVGHGKRFNRKKVIRHVVSKTHATSFETKPDALEGDPCFADEGSAVITSRGRLLGLTGRSSAGCDGYETHAKLNGTAASDFIVSRLLDMAGEDRHHGHMKDYMPFSEADWVRNRGGCTAEGAQLLVGDFNGDHHDDVLCHDKTTGAQSIEYANALGALLETDEPRIVHWCKSTSGQIFVGDFDGDGHDDLLCHDAITGFKQIDYADSLGRFEGTDWQRDSDWCNERSARLFVGDFNGDERDDILCHDTGTGYKRVDYADPFGRFEGTDWLRDARWCKDRHARLFVGDFGGDDRDDLLCHNATTGHLWIDHADESGRFNGPDWGRDAQWCTQDDERLFIGDFDSDNRTDILCSDTKGRVRIDFSDSTGRFTGDYWQGSSKGCDQGHQEMFIGDFNGDGRDDRGCRDTHNGHQWIDYAYDAPRIETRLRSEMLSRPADHGRVLTGKRMP